MDLEEIRWHNVDWICLAQDRDQWQAHVNVLMNFWVPKQSGEFFAEMRIS
jgi:hypothetical protein